MNVYSAIQRRRSIRRFKDQKVTASSLIKLVDAARLAPSAGNLQALEFITVSKKKKCESVFPTLKWAKYVKSDDAPPKGKRPAAYIIVLINRNILSKGGAHDVGAAVQNILLAALEEGYGTCWMRSIKRDELKKIFNVPDHCDVDSVIAIGKPGESPVTETMRDDVKYWRDDRNLMHVPKRKVDRILHREKY